MQQPLDKQVPSKRPEENIPKKTILTTGERFKDGPMERASKRSLLRMKSLAPYGRSVYFVRLFYWVFTGIQSKRS